MLADLERCPYFVGLPVELVHAIAVHADAERLRPGQIIAARAESAESAWLLAEGEVEVRRPGAGGKDEVKATLRAGMLFGHVELLGGTRRTATWVAGTPVRLVSFSRASFDRLIADPSMVGGAFRRALILAQTNQLIAANRLLTGALAGLPGEASATEEVRRMASDFGVDLE